MIAYVKSQRRRDMRLLLVCDYEPSLLDTLLDTLNRICLSDVVLIRKRGDAYWRDAKTEVIELPLRLFKEEERLGLASILSIVTYLVVATFAGTFEVLKRHLDAIMAVYAFPQGLVAALVGQLTRRKVAILTDLSLIHI